MREPHVGRSDKSPVLPSHRVPAHLARRFHQICLGVTGEILLGEDLTPMLWGVLVAVLALYNLDIRFAAGSEAILPMGLILSLSTVAVLLATPSRSWARMYR